MSLQRSLPLPSSSLRALDILLRGARKPINSEFAIARHLSSFARTRPALPRFTRPAPARVPRRQFHATRRHRDRPRADSSEPEAPRTFSQRLKVLGKQYGWVALGVYLGLSALDFPFCFLAVRLLGTERIGRWEHKVLDTFWRAAGSVFPGVVEWRVAREKAKAEKAAEETGLTGEGSLDVIASGEAGGSGTATIWTQLALAYAVHKSLIFFRVPLTAAVLPKVVKTLRRWGYNVGKAKPKPISTPKPTTNPSG